MLFTDYFRLGVVALMFITQVFLIKKQVEEAERQKIFKIFGILSVITVLGFLIYVSVRQYFSWAEPLRLLPFSESIYFNISYSFTRFWFPYVFSFLIASAVFFIMKRFNKKYEEKFFYKEELFIAANSVFLAGHPGWLIYLILVLVTSILVSSVKTVVKGRGERFSFYYTWLPSAFLVIIISRMLIDTWPMLTVLKMGNI